ncbi:MAG: helix-hairpin-helix domain-containing protein, partial [Candidatus Lokiarchaeota archaeon]|nr:helix-hairpin-helix domain-containing protein [Candidatus Lokiarchaeota archaeon]
MTLDIQLVNGIGKKTAERMKKKGIDSIERLASSNVEDLLKISGIGKDKARRYVTTAQNYLENIKGKERGANIIKEEVTLVSTSSEEI